MENSSDSIRLYEMFHRLDRIMSLFGVIPMIFFFLPHLLCIFSFVGTIDTIHMSDEGADVGITGEITVASQLSRPIARTGSSVEVGAISGEVADFFREFDKSIPNPHPEWHFLKLMGL